jgi:hypothetical protein
MNYFRNSDSTVHTIDQVRAMFPLMSIPAGADLTHLGYTQVAMPAPRRVSRLQFQELIGDARYAEIKTRAKTDIGYEVWLDKFWMVTPNPDGTAIDLDDPRTRTGLERLAGEGGTFTAAQVNQILSGVPL